jgi:hypothetical protein
MNSSVYDREAFDVLSDGAKDLPRDGLAAVVQTPVWHALSLVPFDVVSECAEHGGHIASRERAVDTLDELDACSLMGRPRVSPHACP